MLLKYLINNISKKKKNIKIKGITLDSRKVRKGYMFFALRGQKTNGEKYIEEAVQKGASVIVCSKKCDYKNNNSTIYKSSNLRNLLIKIVSKYFKNKPKNIIAVTGTNGKTSVADLFYQILSLNKVPVASIGTLGIKYKGKIFKSNLTSPDAISIHSNLEKIKNNKIDNVIIEASSHGLHQKRIHGLDLKAGIFTNFSQDHLDYHKTMRSYLKSKLILFKEILKKNKFIIVNKNIKEFPILEKISKKRNLKIIDTDSVFPKLGKKNNLKVFDYQKKNLSLAIIAAKLCNLKEKKIFDSLKKIRGVNGRLELVRKFSNNIKVYVDYAHTPDALLKSIEALKKNYNSKLSLVFGCGGERDIKKRALMAKIANLNCYKIYVTDDNPRNENPEKIRRNILKNITNKNHFNIGSRAQAIKKAISNAEPDEIILVAGKGHEEEQIYKKKIIKFSDKKFIKQLKIRFKIIPIVQQNFLQNKKIIYDIQKIKNLKNFHGIAIDSREIKKDNLFLTLKGKNNDGNKFIPKALIRGAKYIISSRISKKYKKKIIKVNNEMKFLKDYASKKREKSLAKILAITGSAGKTSLKNLLKSLLDNYDLTHCSPKSYNNHFGVPLSLSQLNIKHKFGIFEVGMSKKGEINNLSKLIRPHMAVITNIGEAHIENFKNLREIADAKGEIIKNIDKKGTIILNRDDQFFTHLANKAKMNNVKVISFGMSKNANVYPISITKQKKNKIIKVKLNNEIMSFEVKDINIYNFLSSLTILKELNLNIHKVKKYYKNYKLSEGRGRSYKIKRYKKNFNLIDESYNANPLSVKNAIKNFNLIKKNNFKKYLILGDMLELGEKSEILHKNLSKVINNSDIDKVFIKGDKTLFTYKKLKKNKQGNIFQHNEDVDFTLKNIIANNDYLMIKGSNATGLYNLSKRLIKGN